MFEALGAKVHRYRWLILALSGAFLLASLAMLLRGGDLTGGTIHGIESERAQQIAASIQGRSADTTFVAVFRHPTLDARDGAFHEAMQRALEPLRGDPSVQSILTPDDAGPFLAPGMINGPAHAGFALVSLGGDFKKALHAYPEVRKKLRSDSLAIACTGQVAFMNDLDQVLEHDLLRAELLSLPLALFVLLLVFRTVVAAALPVGVGGLAVVGGIAIVLGLSRHTEIAQYTINVCSLIGLGVAIDYSLFTVSRYREELAAGYDYPTALARAMARAGRVVAFSGLAVGTGLAGLLFFEGSYLHAMGIGGAVVVGLAVVFALTFLPALLAVLGPKIHAGALPLPNLELREGLWKRTAEWVMRRPVGVLLPTLGVLLVLGVPFFHAKLTAADVRVLPDNVEARRAYEILRHDFPDQAANRLVVAVEFPDGPALNKKRIDALFALSGRVAKLPHVVKVESIVDGPDPDMTEEDYEGALLDPSDIGAPLVAAAKKIVVGDRALLAYVVTDTPPESEASRAIVRELRADRAMADGSIVVGGPSALDVDTTAYMLERTPRAVSFVVLVTVVVLFLLFGSVLLPLKAVAMNVVSIAGSFGALVWIFQDGHLLVKEGRPIEPALPPLLFCILFGLSMDYEVLMLSRIQESWERTGDNSRAVAEGLEKTAGLITSAAAIMVAVFGAFAIASVVLVKAVGFGMALAVGLDATLVRILLVPAAMQLFGDANWWAPQSLMSFRRWLGIRRVSREPHSGDVPS
jgi:putative drug exporter of the RND superfamily